MRKSNGDWLSSGDQRGLIIRDRSDRSNWRRMPDGIFRGWPMVAM